MFPPPNTETMNKAQLTALAISCGACVAVAATGGKALVFVQGLAASLPF